MEILLPLLALGALIVAGVFWVKARTASADLSAARERARALEGERDTLKEGQSKRQTKELSRQSELDELRERQKDLKRKLAEALELAKKVKDVESARREVENDAHAAIERSRSEAMAAQTEAKALRAELDQLRFRRTVPPPRIEVPVVPAGPVASAPVINPDAALQAAVQDLEAKLAGERTRVAETQERVRQEQKKAADAGREVERLKAKLSTSEKLYMVQKGEFEVWKDRYRTLEQRLNKNLREVDALQRGVLALEKRLPHTSVQAARAEVAAAEAARLAAAEAAALANEDSEAGAKVTASGDEGPAPVSPEPDSPPPSDESAGLEAKGE